MRKVWVESAILYTRRNEINRYHQNNQSGTRMDGTTVETKEIELEKLIIGGTIAQKNQYDMSLVRVEYFKHPLYKTLWSVIRGLWVRSQPIDLMTVSTELEMQGMLGAAGGHVALVKLASEPYVNVEDRHIQILKDIWERRATVDLLEKALVEAREPKAKVKDILQSLDKHTFELCSGTESKHLSKESELDDVLDSLLTPDSNPCIATPWSGMNKLMGGYRPEELVIIAGRPGMGKTALMVTGQIALAKDGIPSMTFSLDMGRKQLWNRYISQMASIGVKDLEIGREFDNEERAKLVLAASDLKVMPLWVDTHPYRTISDIRMMVRQMVMKHQIKVVFIDHIGKILPDKSGSREQEVSGIVQSLKSLSKEFGITIVAMAQLNRGVEYREDKRPMISDLRESGAIEQEADIVLLAFRPEYYQMDTFPDKLTPAANTMELIAGKVRNGPTGSALLRFNGAITKLEEMPPPTAQMATFGFPSLSLTN